jgi:tungstate transport system permease protein
LCFSRNPFQDCAFYLGGINDESGGHEVDYLVPAFQMAVKLIVSLDQELFQIIFLSLRVSLTAMLIAALIAVPISIVISLGKFWGKTLLINLINTFMGLPPVVVGLVVYILLSNKTGLFPNVRLLFTPTAMIIAQVFLAIPIVSGFTIVAVRTVDSHVRNTAISLGVSGIQMILLIIKEARYSIGAGIIAGLGRLMAEVGAVMMVGGNVRYQTRVMTTTIAMQKSMGEFQMALALGIILLVISFLLNFMVDRIRTGKELER